MELAALRAKMDLGDLAESQLVELARTGDENAIRTLIQRNNRRLFRCARAVVRDDGEAEDIVQEAYVKAFTKLDSFRGDASFATWLTRIALNVALGRVRKGRPVAAFVDLDTVNADRAEGRVIMLPTSLTSRSADAEVGRRQVRELLERAIDQLPEPFRIVFVLREIEELTIEETASQLSLKPETVKTRLHRARRLIRAALQEQLSAGFSELYPFAGARCERMADRVIKRLRSTAG